MITVTDREEYSWDLWKWLPVIVCANISFSLTLTNGPDRAMSTCN